MTPPRLVWSWQAFNEKTGPLPVAVVGETRAETWASCAGCPRRPDAAEQLGIPRCYAWGSIAGSMGLNNAQRRAVADPRRLDARAALEERRADARAVRLGGVGDPGRAEPGEVLDAIAAARAAGLAVLCYTHFPGEAEHLREDALASCDTLAAAHRAKAAGWRVALTVDVAAPAAGPWLEVDGLRLLVCPEQRGRDVTCNTCRLCDPRGPLLAAGRADGIAFLAHGQDARGGAGDRRRLPVVGGGQAAGQSGSGAVTRLVTQRQRPVQRSFVDLSGRTIGRWLVLERAPDRVFQSGQRKTYFRCRCLDCGKVHDVAAQRLREGPAAGKRGATRCQDCDRQRRAVPDGRRCRWCPKPAPRGVECVACSQRASRNGRDADGRPRALTDQERHDRRAAGARRALALRRGAAS